MISCDLFGNRIYSIIQCKFIWEIEVIQWKNRITHISQMNLCNPIGKTEIIIFVRIKFNQNYSCIQNKSIWKQDLYKIILMKNMIISIRNRIHVIL